MRSLTVGHTIHKRGGRHPRLRQAMREARACHDNHSMTKEHGAANGHFFYVRGAG
jgi:hypothetical protein